MKRTIILLAFMIPAIAACSSPVPAGQPGVTETIFNRRFIPTIKPGMTYEQVVRLAGAPGLKIGEDGKASPPSVQYRWSGGRNSILTVKFGNSNKMIEATVLAPNRHTYLIPNSGEVRDISK